jgi:hypothetical protein
MNITDLTPQQLRQAASIKEKLAALNSELRGLLNGEITKSTSRKKRTMSAAVKKKIAAAQRARWAKLR